MLTIAFGRTAGRSSKVARVHNVHQSCLILAFDAFPVVKSISVSTLVCSSECRFCRRHFGCEGFDLPGLETAAVCFSGWATASHRAAGARWTVYAVEVACLGPMLAARSIAVQANGLDLLAMTSSKPRPILQSLTKAPTRGAQQTIHQPYHKQASHLTPTKKSPSHQSIRTMCGWLPNITFFVARWSK